MLPVLILFISVLQPAINLPQKRSAEPVIITSATHPHIPVKPDAINAIKIEVRKKKGLNIAYPLPVTHHLLLPSQLHVLPASNVHSLQHIVSGHQVFSQTVSHSTNITHPTQLVPILVPIQHNLVQHQFQHNQNVQHNLVQHLIPQRIYDVSVIPLHKQKYTQLRAMETEERENINRFRTFYGGYGTGLYFGGHGAGHGFYAYGK